MLGVFSGILAALGVARGSLDPSAPPEDRNLAKFFWVLLGIAAAACLLIWITYG